MPLNNPSPHCPTCKQRRDNYQAAGLIVFIVSLLSCGMLMGITYPLTIYLLIMSSRQCPACRLQNAAKAVEQPHSQAVEKGGLLNQVASGRSDPPIQVASGDPLKQVGLFPLRKAGIRNFK